MTSEGKNWGLRTLEELPKGAFVCEYVGEILTIKEWNKRKLQADNGSKHTHGVLLDSEWGALSVKDNEALCFDATFYGNIARFINHRYAYIFGKHVSCFAKFSVLYYMKDSLCDRIKFMHVFIYFCH